jgi:Peptidase M50B-like
MTPRARRGAGNWFWVAVAVSLVVSLTPWAAILLYPFKLFTTWVHECSHAFAAVLVGGSVMSITIQPNTSGLTQSLVPDNRIASGIVASAGYLGAAAVGCLLLAATRVERWAHRILLGVGIFMLLTVLFWMRNIFGAIVVLAWGVALIALARNGMAQAVRFFLSFLAVQVTLNSVYDIRVLFLIDRGHQSDAATMARLFLLPAWVWATTWMVMSVMMLAATLWTTRNRGFGGR